MTQAPEMEKAVEADIEERLRRYYDKRELPAWGELKEAADEIARLRSLSLSAAPECRAGDAGKIATALGLLSSCVKSGEDWSEHCEKAKNEAFDALTRLADPALECRAGERDAYIIELCAKVAEGYPEQFGEEFVAHGMIGKGQDNAARDIAERIRGLAASPPSAEGWQEIIKRLRTRIKNAGQTNSEDVRAIRQGYLTALDHVEAALSPAAPLVAEKETKP